MDFNCGQVWCWCADISWIIYQIPSCSESCSMGLCFFGSDIAYRSHIFFPSVIWFVLWKINSIVSVPECDFQPWDRWPSLLHIKSVHTGGSIFTKSLYSRMFLVVFTGNAVCYWFHCDCISFGVCFSNLLWAYMCSWCVCHILFEHFSCILECCHMIYFGFSIILVCAFSCPSDVTIFLFFILWDHMG